MGSQLAWLGASRLVLTGTIWKLFERADKVLAPDKRALMAQRIRTFDVRQPMSRISSFIAVWLYFLSVMCLKWRFVAGSLSQ
jgi:hypothetical protein